MMHLGQLHRRVFNFIRCWSLKIAKRFSIANNCEKTKHEMKTGTQKKKLTNKQAKNARRKTRQKKDKLNMNRS